MADAVARAEAAELDLVEIAPTAKPPVCRIMDFGKFKYREAKKQHEAKLKLKQIQVKEVKFRPGTDEGDYKIKLRNLIRFLGEGDKAKITLRFRGREMAHQEFGVRLLERVRNDLEPYSVVESFPRKRPHGQPSRSCSTGIPGPSVFARRPPRAFPRTAAPVESPVAFDQKVMRQARSTRTRLLAGRVQFPTA